MAEKKGRRVRTTSGLVALVVLNTYLYKKGEGARGDYNLWQQQQQQQQPHHPRLFRLLRLPTGQLVEMVEALEF